MNNEILEIAWMKSMLEILLLESKVNDSEWVIDNINLGCQTVAVSIGIRRELRENLLSGFHKAIDKYGYEDQADYHRKDRPYLPAEGTGNSRRHSASGTGLEKMRSRCLSYRHSAQLSITHIRYSRNNVIIPGRVDSQL